MQTKFEKKNNWNKLDFRKIIKITGNDEKIL